MTSTRIGVVGAGTIGRGVAHVCAAAGLDVTLVDSDRGQLVDAIDQVRRDELVLAMMGSTAGSAEREEPSQRIVTSTDLAGIADAEFVIENISEDWGMKERLYREIDRVCGPETIFGVNTSAVPITRVGGVTGRPDRVIGVHFMNPVPLMRAVEVVRGQRTSDSTVAATTRLLASLDKSPIVIQDAPGFVTNRVLMATINEAINCVAEGTATAEQVDTICRECFGHNMGPLETADLIGLDTILNSITVIQDSFRDDKYRPSPLLVRMVEAGDLGRKSGSGFYHYAEERYD